jgi:hypothetical protein
VALFEPGCPFFERFFILGGPRGFRRKKTSTVRPNELMAKNEDHDPVILDLPY